MRPLLPAFLFAPLLLASLPQAQPAATGIDVNQLWQPPRYMLTYDPDLSSRAGADNLLGAYYLITGVEDRFLPPKWNEENRFLTKLGGIGYRLAKLSFVDYPLLSVYPYFFQHEVFGHGYRAREFGYKDIEYSFSGPFSGGGAQTRFRYGSQRLTWDMDIAMAMGGVEANAILAERLKKDWVQSGSMEYHGALLYIMTVTDQANYLSQTDEKDLDGPEPDFSNDMLHYLYAVNHKAGDTVLADYKVRLKDMKDYAGASSFDPYFWFSLWTILKTHLWSGQAQFRNPAFRIGPVRYLPGFGSMLNPWGPEFRFENLLSWDRRTVIARYRIGDDAYRRNWGLDLETSELFSYAGATLDADLHFWRQPRLKLVRGDTQPTESRLGYGQSLTVFLPPFVKRVPVRLALGGDYKTLGFVPGQMLDEGFTMRVSAAWFP
jgi:hypothetical protein